MSIEFLILNPHLIPFLLAFFVGAACLLAAPFLYRVRTGKLVITPTDLTRYEGLERKLMILGVVCVLFGILGAAIVSESYGYRRYFTDIHGNRTIEHSKCDRY